MAKAARHYDNVNSDDEIVQAYYVRGKPEIRHQSTTGGTGDDPSTYSHVWELPLPEPEIGEGEVDPSGAGPIWGDPALAPTTAGAEDKQDAVHPTGGPRSDQTRYYILDRGSAIHVSPPVGGNFAAPVGSGRC